MINNHIIWKIGKIVYDSKDKYENVVEKVSNYFSYYYGNSSFFTRCNVNLMKRFYLEFPIYYKDLEKISWDQYMLILSLNDKRERYFYFYLSLFFKSDLLETAEFINNNYYFRI